MSEQSIPLLLTPELSAKICSYVAAGMGPKEACRLAGIAKSTYYLWLEHAKADEEAGETNVYTEFAEAIADAEARMEGAALSRIRVAAENPKTWTAAAWLLERRFPQRWSLRNRVELSGPDGEPVQVVVKFAKDKAQGDDADSNANAE